MNTTTPPIKTLTDELLGEIEAAANDVRGWTMREYFQEPEEGFLPADWEWYVGTIDEDGNRYPLLNVNAHQYDSEDSEKLAKYYALVNRDDVLAMAAELRTLRAENAELRKDAWRLYELAMQANANCKNAGHYLARHRPELSKLFNGYCEAIDTAMEQAK